MNNDPQDHNDSTSPSLFAPPMGHSGQPSFTIRPAVASVNAEPAARPTGVQPAESPTYQTFDPGKRGGLKNIALASFGILFLLAIAGYFLYQIILGSGTVATIIKNGMSTIESSGGGGDTGSGVSLDDKAAVKPIPKPRSAKEARLQDHAKSFLALKDVKQVDYWLAPPPKGAQEVLVALSPGVDLADGLRTILATSDYRLDGDSYLLTVRTSSMPRAAITIGYYNRYDDPSNLVKFDPAYVNKLIFIYDSLKGVNYEYLDIDFMRNIEVIKKKPMIVYNVSASIDHTKSKQTVSQSLRAWNRALSVSKPDVTSLLYNNGTLNFDGDNQCVRDCRLSDAKLEAIVKLQKEAGYNMVLWNTLWGKGDVNHYNPNDIEAAIYLPNDAENKARVAKFKTSLDRAGISSYLIHSKNKISKARTHDSLPRDDTVVLCK